MRFKSCLRNSRFAVMLMKLDEIGGFVKDYTAAYTHALSSRRNEGMDTAGWEEVGSQLAARALGLDLNGVFHVDQPNRDRLASDLMEHLRTQVDGVS
jgi:hypothetical protein